MDEFYIDPFVPIEKIRQLAFVFHAMFLNLVPWNVYLILSVFKPNAINFLQWISIAIKPPSPSQISAYSLC